MRLPLLLGLVVAGFGCRPAPEPPRVEVSTDAVDVDSDTHRIEFENSLVRVIRYKASPGYRSNPHTHLGGIYVSLSNGKSSTTLESGEVVGGESHFGDAGAFFEFGGIVHTTENVGDSDIEEILVDVKVERGVVVEAPSLDAVRVDPEHYTVEFENELVRLVRIRYPEGYATPLYQHYPGVDVLLSDVTATSGPEGEDSEPVTSPSGHVAWSDGCESHRTRNLGSAIQLVRIELKVE